MRCHDSSQGVNVLVGYATTEDNCLMFVYNVFGYCGIIHTSPVYCVQNFVIVKGTAPFAEKNVQSFGKHNVNFVEFEDNALVIDLSMFTSF